MGGGEAIIEVGMSQEAKEGSQGICDAFCLFRLLNLQQQMKFIFVIRWEIILQKPEKFVNYLQDFVATFQNIDQLEESFALLVSNVPDDVDKEAVEKVL